MRIFNLVLLILLLSCNTRKKETFKLESEAPFFGTSKIGENLYIDILEVSNFEWMSYMFWTRRIFGETSREYKNTLVQASLWLDDDNCIGRGYYDYYLMHPDYRRNPVVCVSQFQVMEFLQWRSDRIFEYYLIKNKVILAQGDQTRVNHFTAENYFNGLYNDEQPDTSYCYYPIYRLPSVQEWTTGKNYFDSLNLSVKIKHCKDKYCSFNVENTFPIVYNVQVNQPDTCFPPLQRTYCEDNKTIFHWFGNASEWLNEPYNHIGGNWKDTSMINFGNPQISIDSASTAIGFRAVCEWHKFDYTK